MQFFDDIRKQPRYIREIMFGLSVLITVSLVGIVWFRSFEEDLFVLLNPEPGKQAEFFAERDRQTPLVYASVTKALGNMRATIYNAFGFMRDYTSEQANIEPEYTGEIHILPLSGDK